MRKIFPALVASASFLASPPVAQEARYSISDLHKLMREKGDGICKESCGAYLSANGWLYNVTFHSDFTGILFIVGIDNNGKYTTLNNAAIDDPEIKKTFNTVKNYDLIARSFGAEIGDASGNIVENEYFGFRDRDILVGTEITPEYKQAYAKIINDIATAIVKSKKQ